MATISSRNAVLASWPDHNTLGVPHPTVCRTRELTGIGESQKSSRLVILAGPGGRHDPTRIGARPGATTARRRLRPVVCGAHYAQDVATAVARTLRISSTAGPSRIGTCCSCGQLRPGLGCV
jgi:hypothetical protein